MEEDLFGHSVAAPPPIVLLLTLPVTATLGLGALLVGTVALSGAISAAGLVARTMTQGTGSGRRRSA